MSTHIQDVIEATIYQFQMERELERLQNGAREDGKVTGHREGLVEGITMAYREFGKHKEDVIIKIKEQCGYTDEEAMELVEKYW